MTDPPKGRACYCTIHAQLTPVIYRQAVANVSADGLRCWWWLYYSHYIYINDIV